MKRKLSALLLIILLLSASAITLSACGESQPDEMKSHVKSLYGENAVLSEYDGDLGVRCNNGTFVGKKNGDVISYKGIPYAEQPVGPLRWKPVSAAADGDGIYEAYYFGKSGIQTEAASEPASYYPQGEDCLTLNVWVNSSNSDTKKPVMVFLHGGAYGWGGTADPMYDGQNLIAKFDDVILITVNYRIGLLGFLDLSILEGGEDYRESGNLGILDQIEALKWIRKNAAAFGGDPDNVTIFGESAGAGSACILAAIPQAEGLFRRAVAQSGSPDLTMTREECLLLTKELIDRTGASSVDDLLSLKEKDLAKLSGELEDYLIYPERDGVVLPEELGELYLAGFDSGVDLMIGTNADETHYWVQEIGSYEAYEASIPVIFESNMLKVKDPDDAASLQDFLNNIGGTRTESYSEFFDEVIFRLPAIRFAETHSCSGSGTYMYYWTYPSAIPYMGACHAVELAYVFNNLEDTIYTGDNIDPVLADRVQRMWVGFARTGDPSIAEIEWPEYDYADRATMILDPDTHVEYDPLGEQRTLMGPVFGDYTFRATFPSVSYNTPTVALYVIAILLFLAAALALLIGMVRRINRKGQKK